MSSLTKRRYVNVSLLLNSQGLKHVKKKTLSTARINTTVPNLGGGGAEGGVICVDQYSYVLKHFIPY